MYDFEIAYYLYKMSKIQSVFLNSTYRAKAYYSAAMALDAYNKYVERMYNKNALKDISFVGAKIEKCIIEIIETGKLKELEELEERYHITDYSLLLNHGIPDALLQKLFQLSVDSAYHLLDKKFLGTLEKKLTKREYGRICNFAEEFSKNEGAYLLAYGRCLADELVDFLRQVKGMEFAEIDGELACGKEKIRKIQICFQYVGSWEELVSRLGKYPRVSNIEEIESKEIIGKTQFGIPFVLTCVDKKDRPYKAISQSVDMAVKGDLHSHSSWTDGIHSIEEMAGEADGRGYEYLAITDHSVSEHMAHGLSENEALSQIEKIHEFNENNGIKLLAGIEVDILPDGKLDYSDELLSQFDFVIAAIHSQLNQEPLVVYQRLEKALSNPYVNILAHPTGRLLGRPGVLFSERSPSKISIESIIDLCKRNHVALEVNCFPERFDLSVKHISMAVKQGVKVSLGSDAHSLAHLCNISYGVEMLKKAQVPPDMVLNTYSYERILGYFREHREKENSIRDETICYSKKDFWYYFGNNTAIVDGRKSIIGIDLTGSEEKESGWTYLKANKAICRKIKSDRELIQTIIQLNPDVVSIDSPLAYPKHRCCARKDCECSKYGIMRESERMLRHFGIMVYPCLIDSMVNLTTRGMKLAKILREMGYTVIESYPGVAQDILLIPRKGKTLEQFAHSKQGLKSFGIVGDLLDNPNISHDEVDSIISALVGYFYLNDQYVGLGNDDEDYLIVPRIQEELLKKRIVIGLCGQTAAGKTTIAQYLQFKYGVQYFRYSKIIAEKYNVTDKEELQKIGAYIAESEERQRDLTRYMLEKMKPDTSYVVDGLRHLEDYEELYQYLGEDFVFVYLECSYSNRYKRYNKLCFNTISKEKFEQINNHKSEIDIGLLQMKASYRVDNNKGFKDLRTQMDKIIEQERGGNI